VEFDKKGGMVEVTMKLDRQVQPRITTKSEANLGSLGLLGEKAMDITPSTEGQPIEDGGYITAAAEDPFKGLLTETSESTSHLNRILARMDAGEGTLGKALRDEELYNRMVDVGIRLQGVMNKLESPRGPLGRLVNDNEMSAQLASSVAVIPVVRAALLQFQRDFAVHPPGGKAGAVLDGRDIGTVVCPAAAAKVYVTASQEERARRRAKELRESGVEAIYGAVLQDMQDRDARDSQRRTAPLRPADDAFVLDTTDLDADAAFAAARDYVASKRVKNVTL